MPIHSIRNPIPEGHRPRSLTPVQRSILDHMIAWGGDAIIQTGYRQTRIATMSNRVATNTTTLWSLGVNGLIEEVDDPTTHRPQPNRFRITEYGRQRRSGEHRE